MTALFLVHNQVDRSTRHQEIPKARCRKQPWSRGSRRMKCFTGSHKRGAYQQYHVFLNHDPLLRKECRLICSRNANALELVPFMSASLSLLTFSFRWSARLIPRFDPLVENLRGVVLPASSHFKPTCPGSSGMHFLLLSLLVRQAFLRNTAKYP